MGEYINRVKKPPNGRPPELTDELRDKIVNLIRIGNYVETAAIASGISKQTLYVWMKKGHKEKSGKYKKFVDSLQKAMGEAEAIDVNNIAKAAAKGNWTASAWRLERKFPNRWGRTDRIEANHTGAVLTLNYMIEKKVEKNVSEEAEPADIDLLRS